jgi:hypothetical protein
MPDFGKQSLSHVFRSSGSPDCQKRNDLWSARSFVPVAVSVMRLFEGPSFPVPKSELGYDTSEAAQCAVSVGASSAPLVRQVELVLQKVHPRHDAQAHRLTPFVRFGIIRLTQGFQLRQEPLSAETALGGWFAQTFQKLDCRANIIRAMCRIAIST